MTSLGDDLMDVVYTRITALSLGVDLKYKGLQGSGSSDYILFLDDNESESLENSDKDKTANRIDVMLQFWGAKPRTLSRRAKTVIDDLVDKGNPPIVSGFTHLFTKLIRNQRTPSFRTTGEASQESRVVQFQFIYEPT